MRSVVLTGGVGGSGFLWGLAQALDHEALTVVVSTGDDFELHGLRTAILVVGLAWVWAHGDLEWVKNLTGASYEAPAPGSSETAPRKAA